MLKYTKTSHNLAIKCLALADFCNVDVSKELSDQDTKLSLQLDGGTTLEGSGTICSFFVNVNSQDIIRRTKTIQWISFVNSEISAYPPNSKEMKRSMGSLDTIIAGQKFLSGSDLSETDFIVGYPLLSLPSQIYSSFPNLSGWLDRVKMETKPWSDKLEVKLVKNKENPKKDSKKAGCGKVQETEVKKRKLRLLCIHGYRQSAKTSREKLGSFRKLVGKVAELDFITAPHQIPSDNPEEQDQFGWWFSQSSKSFDAHEETDCDLGFQQSVDLITETLRKADQSGSPYDGIFSFSQGASLAAYYCLLQHLGKLDVNFKFCILVAGFVSRTLSHKEQFSGLVDNDNKISLPTLHVFGQTDRVIEGEMSEELQTYFSSVETLRHSGGHFVPATGEDKKVFVNFLVKMQNEIL